MNPTHLTRQELYEELAEAKKEAEHYKHLEQKRTKAFARLLDDFHIFMKEMKNEI
jgi:hypothetical protein